MNIKIGRIVKKLRTEKSDWRYAAGNLSLGIRKRVSRYRTAPIACRLFQRDHRRTSWVQTFRAGNRYCKHQERDVASQRGRYD